MSVSLANRSPILIYRTEAFVQPTTITGPMEASLYFSTTARDAGLHVMVFEQDSRGKLWLLGSPGTHRVTYRDGDYFSLKPHQVVKVNVRPWWIAHQLKPGSRLAIGVFSDARPTFAPIPGTGEFEGTATKYIKATHTIHTSAKYPSSFSFYLSE
jgi:predicted acyl esterase